MGRQAKQVLTSNERLEIGFSILESVRQRRLSSGDPGVGPAIECRVLERELRDLEGGCATSRHFCPNERTARKPASSGAGFELKDSTSYGRARRKIGPSKVMSRRHTGRCLPRRRRSFVLLWPCLAGPVTLGLRPSAWMVPRQRVEEARGHFLTYLVLATIPAVAIKRPGRTRAEILSVACLGMVLEVAQMHIPGRVFEWRNVLANSTCCRVGMLAALPLRLGVAVALLAGQARSSRLAVLE